MRKRSAFAPAVMAFVLVVAPHSPKVAAQGPRQFLP